MGKDTEDILCPQCGRKTTYGYGLAFGGDCTAYLFCPDCDWHIKGIESISDFCQAYLISNRQVNTTVKTLLKDDLKGYSMSNVYVINFSGHNISTCKRFIKEGNIIYLTEGAVNIFNIDRVIYDLKAKLENYNGNDYILLSGNVVLNVLVALILKDKTEHLNLLIWDARENVRDYKLRTVNTKTLTGE